MAYPISSTALDLFQAPYRQVVSITFDGIEESFSITEQSIPSGGMSVNRYCVSGNKIEIGSVIASELTLVLDNSDGKYDDVVFEGAELYVRAGVKKWDANTWEKAELHYVPLGYFTVDETPRKLRSITLSALDRMVRFDKKVDNSLLPFPMSVGALLNRICNICNVVCDTDLSSFPNNSYMIKAAPQGEDLTYRQYLSWIAEITGTCGFINWNGHLVLKWYESTDTVLTVKERFTSDLHENAITLTGVQIVDPDDKVYLIGSDEYAINIESNSLIQHDFQTVAKGLYNVLNGFTYTPFTATVKPMPHLYPLDRFSFVDKNGVNHFTIITDCTFTLNQNTVLAARGETSTKNGYALMNPLTKREQTILSKMDRNINNTISSREQAVLSLNETICNSVGLRMTTVETDEGGEIYYFHDNETLEESTIIYTYKSGGFAWSHDWNNGEPVWQYGFTQDGNAVFNALSTYKIQTDYLDAECVTAEKIAMAYKNSVSAEIAGASATLRQEFVAADGVLKSYIETNYATSSTMSSQIQQTSDSIMSEVNKKVNDSDFGTKITQNYSSVRIAWNSISKYIEFSDGAINIYTSTDQGSENLLCKMTHTGSWYYHKGTTIGRIGTNNFVDDESFKGLVFDLESDAKYMCWAHRENANDSTYVTKLIYFADDSEQLKGLHFHCNTYCGSNLFINEKVKSLAYSDGSGGWYSYNGTVFLEGKGCALRCGDNFLLENSTNSLVDCYNNIDMHNYDILNQSDARFKTNIEPSVVDALGLISQIEMKQFDWIESGEHCDVGMIAQQLQEITPDLVNENKVTGRLSIKTNKLIPYLLKAVQEIMTILNSGIATMSLDDEAGGWVDPYSDEEKMEFIEANSLKNDATIVETEDIRIPVYKEVKSNAG